MKSGSKKQRRKISPWHTKNSKIVLEDKWIKVRADECTTKEGATISPYYVLEYPDWVHMVVINSKGEVLVTRQYRHGSGKISFELPCGTQDTNDKTPLAAAKRELLEETGYNGDFTLAGKVSPNPATHNNTIYVFLIINPVKQSLAQDNPTEVIDYLFMSTKKIYELIDRGKFIQALHISSLILGLRQHQS